MNAKMECVRTAQRQVLRSFVKTNENKIVLQYAPMEFLLDVILDALKDTAYLVPFLYVTYVAMEWLEHRTATKTQDAVRKAGVAGPALGALLGVVPQCGFSAAAATLYAGRVVTLGTLIAVFLATSDEMLPIFIAEQVPAGTIFAILGTKVAIGMVCGFLVDAVLRLTHHTSDSLKIHELCEADKCHCEDDCETCAEHPEMVYTHFEDCADECDHTHHHHNHAHDEHHGWGEILKSALVHTLQVLLYVFLISIALNVVLGLVGEDALAAAVSGNEFASIVVAALVGLIPNCAASVVIAQLYLEGVLGAGAMLSGLLSAAGVGLLVLLRTNRHHNENLAIVGILLAASIAFGVLTNLLGIVF